MKLLVRREFFGYLFIDRDDERLFVVETADELDFSNTERYEFVDSTGQFVTPKQIELRPSKILRNDILCAPTYVEFYPTLSCNEPITDDVASLWANSSVLNELRSREPKAACLHCNHFEYCRGGYATNLRTGVDNQTLPHCPLFYPLLAAE